MIWITFVKKIDNTQYLSMRVMKLFEILQITMMFWFVKIYQRDLSTYSQHIKQWMLGLFLMIHARIMIARLSGIVSRMFALANVPFLLTFSRRFMKSFYTKWNGRLLIRFLIPGSRSLYRAGRFVVTTFTIIVWFRLLIDWGIVTFHVNTFFSP